MLARAVERDSEQISNELMAKLSHEDGRVMEEIRALEREYVCKRRDIITEMRAAEHLVRSRARTMLKDRASKDMQDRASGYAYLHQDVRQARAELRTLPVTPDFFTLLDDLNCLTCQKLLRYGDDMCLRFKYRLGWSMTEALARYRARMARPGVGGSQPCDVAGGSHPCDWGGEDLALRFAEAGLITWTKEQGRKPHNMLQLRPTDMIASLRLNEPHRAAQWFLEFLHLDADAALKDGWSPAICTELGLDASSRPRSTVHGIENQFALERKQGNELMAKLSHEDGRVLKEIQASWPYDRAQEGRHLPIRADDVDDD